MQICWGGRKLHGVELEINHKEYFLHAGTGRCSYSKGGIVHALFSGTKAVCVADLLLLGIESLYGA